MLLKDAFKRESIEYGMRKSFNNLISEFDFVEIKLNDRNSCVENMFGFAVKKNDLIISAFNSLFEYQIIFEQKTENGILKTDWNGIWRKFIKENNVSDFDNISLKKLWKKEIPIIIDYSKPLNNSQMENILKHQFEFINRHYSKILIDADIKYVVE